jgi:hypothetical protein
MSGVRSRRHAALLAAVQNLSLNDSSTSRAFRGRVSSGESASSRRTSSVQNRSRNSRFRNSNRSSPAIRRWKRLASARCHASSGSILSNVAQQIGSRDDRSPTLARNVEAAWLPIWKQRQNVVAYVLAGPWRESGCNLPDRGCQPHYVGFAPACVCHHGAPGEQRLIAKHSSGEPQEPVLRVPGARREYANQFRFCGCRIQGR